GMICHAPPHPSLEPVLWKNLTADDGQIRPAVLGQLAKIGVHDGNLAKWQEIARHSSREARETALVLLADHAAEASVDLLIEELPRASYSTKEHLIAAIKELSSGRDPSFAERLLPLMASGDAATRSAVLKILLAMDNRPEIIKRYFLFSRTLAGWARDRALDSLREFGADLIEPTLALLEHPDEDVRAVALTVASSFEDTRIVPAMIGRLHDHDWWLRLTAADALGHIGDPRAVQALTEALEDPEIRWAAVEALGRIGDPRALPALARLLKDPAPEIRIEVLLAMQRFEHPKIVTALRQVAATDPNRMVRTRALEIAEKLADRDNVVFADAEALRSQAFQATVSEGEPALHALLVTARNRHASDLHIAAGSPPLIRSGSELIPLEPEPLTPVQTERMLRELLTHEQWRKFEETTQVDFCTYVPRAGRYRGNVFRDRRGINAVFRVIPEKPPTLSELGLPGHLAEISSTQQGLVLICGPAGSGKSTTLTALVNLINETRYDHIITLEDPVEFVHPFKSCLVNQREVGAHTRSFARALRAALREDPDVLIIGDLRDTETIGLALTAAETGHLVLATLDATTAPKAIERIISSFPAVRQTQVRASLADSLKVVIAQRLLPGREEHTQVACFEILKATVSVISMIRDAKTHQLLSVMQTGRTHGMQTFDDSLEDLLHQQLISPATAYLMARSKDAFIEGGALKPEDSIRDGS
ncbi:MAG: PilT/PilU family type 4a pilus ATPase, partial [Nitrospiraceae bacterium]|nr:PilT/PilU family type 4a pilus ATPase [Nitrospiraceae bacterium]